MKTALFVCGCIVAAAIVCLSQSNDAALKRRILPWYLLGIDAAGIAFVWVTEHSLGLVFLAIPCLVVITALNMKLIEFCDQCGKTVQGWWCVEPLICPRCGADLQSDAPIEGPVKWGYPKLDVQKRPISGFAAVHLFPKADALGYVLSPSRDQPTRVRSALTGCSR